MQRLKLKHHGKLRGALGLVFYDVTSDFSSESEGESHNYWIAANVWVEPFVEGAWTKPGMRNVAGVMVCEP